mgnify:FL=1
MKSQHHLTFAELPDEIKERAKDAINLAERVKDIDIRKITQEQVNKLYYEVKAIKETTVVHDVIKLGSK